MYRAVFLGYLLAAVAMPAAAESALADLLAVSADAASQLYVLPEDGDDLVGDWASAFPMAEDSLVTLAYRHRVGYNAIRGANPAVDAWLPDPFRPVILPVRQLLPMAERQGIVINVAEMRLYYFLEATDTLPARVAIFPVSVGRGDWNTPLATSRVVRKAQDPNWYPPASIRAEHARDGDPLPAVVPGGPDNPLGRHALYLNLPGYLLHGSNKQFGIGMQVTHGCLRLYPEHIAFLYDRVPVGTRVRLLHQRFKLGWADGALYLEVHPPLDGEVASLQTDLEHLTVKVTEFIRQHTGSADSYPVDWNQARVMVMEASGMPRAIGPQLGGLGGGQKRLVAEE